MTAVPRKTLGRFEIVRVLGKGAMGVVYEGRDPRLNRRVAIKTILRSAVGDEEEAREYAQRFVREAQAVARLSHPNVVGVYDFGEDGDVTFIVMEFLEGRDLKSYFDAGQRFDFPTTVRMMNELLDGLGYAHRNGVIHRDVKPANIMLDSTGRVKLTDFGVARITESTDRTQAGTMVGTPSYMSPEQIQGMPVDNRTDLFACGVILYQLLTGERPFSGAGTWTIYNQILQQDPQPPTVLNSALPPAIDRVVSRALAKNRDDRFRDAQEFSAALTGLLLGTATGEGSGDADADATRFLLPSDAIRLAESAAQRRADTSGTSGTYPGVQATVPPGLASQAGQEIELEFWRSIKDSVDPADYDLYLEKFPAGVYAELARRKAQRLRSPGDATGDRSAPGIRGPDAAAGDAAEAEDATVVAAGPTPVRPSTNVTASDHRSAPGEAAMAGPHKSRSLARVGAAAAVLVALVAGIWWLFGQGGEPPAAPPLAAPTPSDPPPMQVAPAPAPARPSPDMPAADASADSIRPKADDDAVRRGEAAIERAKAEAEQAALQKAADERAAAEKAAEAARAATARAAAARAAAEQAAREKAAAERAAADKRAAERAAAEKAAAERATAKQTAAERAAAERAAAERAAAERAAAERAAAEKAAAEKVAAERAAAEKAARAAALKAAAEKAAAEKAAAERAIAEQAAAQRLQMPPPPSAGATSTEPAKRAGGRQN